jgi:hypothetical protein
MNTKLTPESRYRIKCLFSARGICCVSTSHTKYIKTFSSYEIISVCRKVEGWGLEVEGEEIRGLYRELAYMGTTKYSLSNDLFTEINK